MKLTGTHAQNYIKNPHSKYAAILLFGAHKLRIDSARISIVKTLGGKNLEADMRLTEIAGADLRSNKSLLLDTQKAQGFFPGTRITVIRSATDSLAPLFETSSYSMERGAMRLWL